MVKINFKNRFFKEIKEVRAYNLQALIGNAGGYIGLFLGFALKEIPTQLLILFRMVTNKMRNEI